MVVTPRKDRRATSLPAVAKFKPVEINDEHTDENGVPFPIDLTDIEAHSRAFHVMRLQLHNQNEYLSK